MPGRFYTTLYSRAFRLTDDGIVYLALDTTARPTLARPLLVTVVVRAEGYLDVVLECRERTSDQLQSIETDLISRIGYSTL